MKKLKAKNKLILIVTIFMIFSFVSGVFASSTVQAITAYLAGDFKFTLNGENWQPRDVDGSQMSPIVYKNRTYLPVRAIGEALGVNIGWIDATRTVVIGEEEEQEQPPLTIEDLPVDFTIKNPDLIGNVYMDATYKNNSDKNIVGFNVTVLLKDSNETTYLCSSDTVLPGETSPNFETFGPKTLNRNDIQFTKYNITIANDDGSKTYLIYDPKLDQYDWY